jgi:hypothetical protein
MKWLRWLFPERIRRAEETGSAVDEANGSSRPSEDYDFVKPEYCRNGCGRLESRCVSAGSEHNKCGDIFDERRRDSPVDRGWGVESPRVESSSHEDMGKSF